MQRSGLAPTHQLMLSAPIIALAVWSTLIGVADLRHRRIPNALTFPAVLTAFAWMLLHGRSLIGAPWESALMAAAFGLAVTVPAYALGKLGAGDAKFLFAIGLLTGWDHTVATFVTASLMAAAIAMLWWLKRDTFTEHLHPLFRQPIHWVVGSGANTGQLRLPYGTLLAMGLMAVLLGK